MGSTTTSSRKKNDSRIINLPKNKSGGGENIGVTGKEHADMNNVCPPSFRVKLTPQKLIPEGAQLQLAGKDILFAGQKVGSLSKLQAATINRCLNEGFRYSGEVVNKQGGQYGIFRRE